MRRWRGGRTCPDVMGAECGVVVGIHPIDGHLQNHFLAEASLFSQREDQRGQRRRL